MKNWSLLGKYTKPYRLYVVAVFINIFITSVVVLSLGQGLRYVVDNGFLTQERWSSFSSIALLFLALIAVMCITIFTRIYLISYSGEGIISDIRIDAYSHLLKLPQQFFEAKKIGDILSTLISDTATLQIIISGALSNLLRNFAMVVVGAVMLVYTSMKLSAYSFIAIPSIILIISFLGKRVRKLSKKARDSIANIASYSEETLNGIRTVQAFTYEKYAISKFSEYTRYTRNCFVAYEVMRGFLVILVIFAVLLTVGFIFWEGNNSVINGKMSYGELSAFMFYAIMIANSVSRLGEIFSELQQAGAAIQRLEELFFQGNDPLVESKSTCVIPDKIKNLTFSNVTFCYIPESGIPTISDISFTIQAGEKVAIVGPSGAGKSTIIDLLLRFYEINSGSITINGINIKEFSTYDLRKLFAIVPQDPVIFSASIMDNILYGDPESCYDDVTSAAKYAHATEFINRLEKKFRSFVGEKGLKLSGGQKQRIAIARAIVKNAKILLLDEATSSLDTENEKLIQDSFQHLNCVITIIIAHRLSTVRDANKIIVIDKGKIVDVGTHEALLAKNGLYTKLITLQDIN